MTLPDNLKALFWDVDQSTFDPVVWPEYTISRVLELGDDPAVAWMRETFSTDQIAEVIRTDRKLSPKSANYWALVYQIPVEQVAALGSRGTPNDALA